MKKIITLITLILISCSEKPISDPSDILNFIDKTSTNCQKEFNNSYWGDCFTHQGLSNIYFIAFYGKNDIEMLTKINLNLNKGIANDMEHEVANKFYADLISDLKLILVAYNENNSSQIAYSRNQIKLKLVAVIKSNKNIENKPDN
jgi:hypothetical protein